MIVPRRLIGNRRESPSVWSLKFHGLIFDGGSKLILQPVILPLGPIEGCPPCWCRSVSRNSGT
jgi:hypothetical protein